MNERQSAARMAIRAAGGYAEVAQACDVTVHTVRQWTKRGVSFRYLQRLSRLSGIPARVIRPDLYDDVA